jgi:hypothetical protein
MCDSARCPQATRRLCHRPAWAEYADKTMIFISQFGTTRKTASARLRPSLAVVAETDAASTSMSEESA